MRLASSDLSTYQGRSRLASQGAHVMAIINLVPRLPLRQAVTNVPDARRDYDANLEEAVKLFLLAPG